MNLTLNGIVVQIDEADVERIVAARLSETKSIIDTTCLDETVATRECNFRSSLPPRIGDEWIGEGGTYAGVVRGRHCSHDFHLIVGPENGRGLAWTDAWNWAVKLPGGDFRLPSLAEMAIAFANVPELFNRDLLYWSSHQLDKTCGYMNFGTGGQGFDFENNRFFARAVRLIPVGVPTEQA